MKIPGMAEIKQLKEFPTEQCILCDEYDFLVQHHTNYAKDDTISICPDCHRKIHNQDDYYSHLKPIDTPDDAPKEKRESRQSRNMVKMTYLTQEEMKNLLAAIQLKRDRALFLIAYRHGLRASEVGLLRKNDVDWDRLKIYIHRLKGGLPGEQIMGTDEVKILRSYLRQRKDSSEILFLSKKENPIGARQLNHLMKKYCADAGIPKEKAHFHSLRHSIGVHLMDAGADVLFVRDILGHKNIQNTLIYAQITSARRDEIHRQLLGSSRIV